MPTVRTNGIRTYYEEYGEGPPIVFLHGAMSDHRLWAEQAKPLASDYRVITYDMRGHGRTGHSDTSSYTRELYVEDLDALITALNLRNPSVCGLSAGGMIAQRYAAKYPDAIATLCTMGTLTPEVFSHGEWFELRTLPKLIERSSPTFVRDRLFALLDWINERRFGSGAIGDLEKLERIQQVHAKEYPEIREIELEKLDEMLMSRPSLPVDYTSITVPSLLMYGERDRGAVARHANRMADVIPHTAVRRIPNAGHNSHVDNPEFIVELLRDFLSTAVEH